MRILYCEREREREKLVAARFCRSNRFEGREILDTRGPSIGANFPTINRIKERGLGNN